MSDFTFGSLFSGIGGLDLGLERAGMKCAWQSEIEPYACRVLAKHWPDIPNLGDIRDIDWTAIPRVDLVAGGYPCQPFSHAGKRNGTNDPRHLWPMFAECLRVLRPRFALLENVSGHLTLGFGDVQADLATLGYDAQWDCIPAAAVGAPHLRDRIFVIATRSDMGDTNDSRSSDRAQARTVNGDRRCDNENGSSRESLERRIGGSSSIVADSTGRRCETTEGETLRIIRNANARWNDCLTTSRRNRWQSEPNVGRVADGIPNRLDRLKGLGNAVVPQVAEHMGRIIMDMQ